MEDHSSMTPNPETVYLKYPYVYTSRVINLKKTLNTHTYTRTGTVGEEKSLKSNLSTLWTTDSSGVRDVSPGDWGSPEWDRLRCLVSRMEHGT